MQLPSSNEELRIRRKKTRRGTKGANPHNFGKLGK